MEQTPVLSNGLTQFNESHKCKCECARQQHDTNPLKEWHWANLEEPRSDLWILELDYCSTIGAKGKLSDSASGFAENGTHMNAHTSPSAISSASTPELSRNARIPFAVASPSSKQALINRQSVTLTRLCCCNRRSEKSTPSQKTWPASIALSSEVVLRSVSKDVALRSLREVMVLDGNLRPQWRDLTDHRGLGLQLSGATWTGPTVEQRPARWVYV